jgi:hypothetical protein
MVLLMVPLSQKRCPVSGNAHACLRCKTETQEMNSVELQQADIAIIDAQ